ncbi:secreted RxLR effector protein 78-like [Rutidosis leptorrhynchoides]|uniref:secreted RxLR effector protein 78-like n=1 Tax=Rutidosis leptorrhynchoides TaxID=125765 RepID=UPI003A98F731
MVFLDLEKAYDCVPRKLIWKTLNIRVIPSRYIKAIMDMYDGVKSCVRMPVGNTDYFPIELGLRQGSALSPFLFALILDELSRDIQGNIPWSLLFADDIVLIADSKNELNRRLEQWREALEQNGLRISRQKTEYLRCDFDRVEDEHNAGVNISIGDQIFVTDVAGIP